MGAVTGSLEHPKVLVVGRYRGKTLEMVGRTVPLTTAQSRAVGEVLKPAAASHPWPDRLSTHWGQSKTPIVKVRPRVVAEVDADAAVDENGHYCHPLRFLRHRSDLNPVDVETLPSGKGLA